MIAATFFGGPRDGDVVAVNDRPDTLGRLQPIVLPEFTARYFGDQDFTVKKRYYEPDMSTLKACPCCPDDEPSHWSCTYRYVRDE